MSLNVGRNAHAIFCDDMRQENTGKFIYIGCYQSNMFVGEFPFQTFLRVRVFFSTPQSRPLKAIKVCIHLDGEEITKIELTEKQIKEFNSSATTELSEDPLLSGNFDFGLTPINFEKTGLLEAEVCTEEGTMRAGQLKIALRPNNENHQAN